MKRKLFTEGRCRRLRWQPINHPLKSLKFLCKSMFDILIGKCQNKMPALLLLYLRLYQTHPKWQWLTPAPSNAITSYRNNASNVLRKVRTASAMQIWDPLSTSTSDFPKVLQIPSSLGHQRFASSNAVDLYNIKAVSRERRKLRNKNIKLNPLKKQPLE